MLARQLLLAHDYGAGCWLKSSGGILADTGGCWRPLSHSQSLVQGHQHQRGCQSSSLLPLSSLLLQSSLTLACARSPSFCCLSERFVCGHSQRHVQPMPMLKPSLRLPSSRR